MRKMIMLYESDAKKITNKVNDIYKKAEESGYQIISTQIVKEPMSIFFAFIEYETKVPTAK